MRIRAPRMTRCRQNRTTTMKMTYGSIQQKGRTFYYVSRIHGKQKWISLKTDDHGLAR